VQASENVFLTEPVRIDRARKRHEAISDIEDEVVLSHSPGNWVLSPRQISRDRRPGEVELKPPRKPPSLPRQPRKVLPVQEHRTAAREVEN
jgi:hypothetical protein